MPRCLPASLPRGSGARQTTTVKPVSPAMSKLSSVRNAPYVLSWSALVFGLRSSCGWKFGVIRKGARDILLLTSPAPPSFPRAAADPPPPPDFDGGIAASRGARLRLAEECPRWPGVACGMGSGPRKPCAPRESSAAANRKYVDSRPEEALIVFRSAARCCVDRVL